MPTTYTYTYRCSGPGDGAFAGCNYEYTDAQRQFVRREARKHRMHDHGEIYTMPLQLDAMIQAKAG